MDSFKECPTCAAKPGTPVLCESCLHNRDVIASLKRQLDEKKRHIFGLDYWLDAKKTPASTLSDADIDRIAERIISKLWNTPAPLTACQSQDGETYA